MTGYVGPIQGVVHGIYDGPHATPPEADSGPVFLGIKNVTPEGRLDLSEIRHVSEEYYPKWTRRVTPQTNDIVFSYEATLHRYAIIPEGFRGCLGRRMALLRPNPDRIIPRFLHYYLLSRGWRSIVERNVINGATVDRIPLTRLPDFEISIPELSVQRRIVSILSEYDDLIENNRRRVHLLEQTARLLYDDWFVHLRFPDHNRVTIADGVPEGWERKTVPEIIKINPQVDSPNDIPIRYVPMAGLSTSGMTIDLTYSETRAKSTSVRFRNGDVLLARITPCLENGKTGFVNFLRDDEIACGSTEFIVLRGTSVSSFFTYCFARTYTFRQTAIKSMIGSSGRQRVQSNCFDDFVVATPPHAVRDQFDNVCKPIFTQIASLTSKIYLLTRIRGLLLPRLMNGEVRV